MMVLVLFRRSSSPPSKAQSGELGMDVPFSFFFFFLSSRVLSPFECFPEGKRIKVTLGSSGGNMLISFVTALSLHVRLWLHPFTDSTFPLDLPSTLRFWVNLHSYLLSPQHPTHGLPRNFGGTVSPGPNTSPWLLSSELGAIPCGVQPLLRRVTVAN